MSLGFVRPEFVLCPRCAAKPGSPELCRECLERRELHDLTRRIHQSPGLPEFTRRAAGICVFCVGTPHPECPEHGR